MSKTLQGKYAERLEKENKELKQRIDKTLNYIKEKYDYVLGDTTFLDHDELVDRKQILHILEILGDKENEN